MKPTKFLTNTELSLFTECRRKWWLSYVMKLEWPEPAVSKARDVGSVVHAVLEYHYANFMPELKDTMKQFDAEMALQRAPFLAIMNEEEKVEISMFGGSPSSIREASWPKRARAEVALEELDWVAEWAEIMLIGYFDWLAEEGHDANLTVIEPEAEVAVPLDGAGTLGMYSNVKLAGKYDVRVLDEEDGFRKFLETKTAGTFQIYETMPHMLTQVFHYHLLEYLELEQAGEGQKTDGAILNIIRRVKRTSRAKPPFYCRFSVHHNESEIKNYYTRILGILRDMLQCEMELAEGKDHRAVVYPTPTSNCHWKCEFFDICGLLDDDNAHGLEMAQEMFVVGNPLSQYDSEIGHITNH